MEKYGSNTLFCEKSDKKQLTIRLLAFIIELYTVRYNTVSGGETMAMHTIDRVREAEQKATQSRLEAEAKAQEIVDNAHKEAEQIVARAKAESSRRLAEASDLAKQKAASLVASHREKARAEADALREKTMSLRQNVINKLIEETLV
jgi:vacuolar-type H+-ATPase subunit H